MEVEDDYMNIKHAESCDCLEIGLLSMCRCFCFCLFSTQSTDFFVALAARNVMNNKQQAALDTGVFIRILGSQSWPILVLRKFPNLPLDVPQDQQIYFHHFMRPKNSA